MAEIRARKRQELEEREEHKKQKKAKAASIVYSFRDEDSDRKAKLMKELEQAGGQGDGMGRRGARRALTAQEKRAIEEQQKLNKHRHERKETHKKASFKSLNKYKRRKK